jgi:uncharacterized lipoprotein YehR (DUF1307 family)
MKGKKLLGILLVALVAIAIIVSGCGDNSSDSNGNSIVGVWAYNSFVYTFNSDKTGDYDVAGTKMDFTYEAKNGDLSILYSGNTIPYETTFRIDGKTLYLMDSFGEEVAYEKK